ncbi:MAG: Glu/Leu/Phe/Val dehydrogenase [Spirochaetes bacterium]|nr:Glu/Leu/Phe/Val dehydrogenase [Spirochaetota bacterium]
MNVGRDFPGRLARIIEENMSMRIISFDSVKSSSGVRIISLEQAGRKEMAVRDDELALIEVVKNECLVNNGKYARTFLDNLPPNYMSEEINVLRTRSRIKRHLQLFSLAMELSGVVVSTEEAEDGQENLGHIPEIRISIAAKNADRGFVLRVLRVIEKQRINLHRTYLDTFGTGLPGGSVQVMTLYAERKNGVEFPVSDIKGVVITNGPETSRKNPEVETRLEEIVRVISDGETSDEQSSTMLSHLRNLIAENSDLTSNEEMMNFLLNAITDFYRAAEFLSLHEKDRIMRKLLRFEHLSEFYVASNKGVRNENLPGYRFAHNSARGSAKGGLRLDSIVQFDEVCALSFMMTWKTSRTKILFGGAKGGMVINPGDFTDRTLDFVDTVANFGRSLFLVTGPVHDVPAGDVGCGPSEIGILFEGFKSALRDLALVAYGVKRGVTVVGNRVISLEEARKILREHFDIDWSDRLLLRRLITDEHYLELVVAPQITGKPRMGIAARTGATGRGLLYCVLAMVTRLYLDGKWESVEPISQRDTELLHSVARYNESAVLNGSGQPVVDLQRWQYLTDTVFPKLLRDKRMIVQGTGKVGGSVLTEFAPYGVNLVAVSDAGGAIIGDHLKIEEILGCVSSSREHSCVGVKTNVTRTIFGAREGSSILEMECDLLLPCALENVITVEVASRINAKIVASGGNGTNTSKGESVLHRRGITVIYDFLANGGGVTVSYFEWLRNFYERRRFESEEIGGFPFDPTTMEQYLMPEYRQRILDILAIPEGDGVTELWNLLLRDIMISAVNDDYGFARSHDVSMKTAGFANSILRVLAAEMARSGEDGRKAIWNAIPEKTRAMMRPFIEHPEMRQYCRSQEEYDEMLKPME